MAREKRIINENIIMRVLAKQADPNAANRLFESLLKEGKVATHKTASARDNVQLYRKFGQGSLEFPKISENYAPFKDLTRDSKDEQNLKGLLIAAVTAVGPEIGGNYFAIVDDEEKAGKDIDEGDETDKEVTAQSFVEKVFQGKGYIRGIPSEALEAVLDDVLRKEEQKQEVVHTELPKFSALPPGILLGLDHNAPSCHTYVTVVRGEMVWIFWPPTADNLAVLQQVYRSKIGASIENTKAVTEKLTDGVIIGHKAGDRLHLPPLCLYMCVPTESTVIATYQVMFATSFVDSLRVASNFYQSWFASHAETELLAREYSDRQLVMTQRILRCEFDSYEQDEWAKNTDTAGPLRDLIRTWDEVKNNVVELLAPDDAIKMRNSWVEVLETFRRDDCVICGARNTDFDNAGRHFDKAHWPLVSSKEITHMTDNPKEFLDARKSAYSDVEETSSGVHGSHREEIKSVTDGPDSLDLSFIDPHILDIP